MAQGKQGTRHAATLAAALAALPPAPSRCRVCTLPAPVQRDIRAAVAAGTYKTRIASALRLMGHPLSADSIKYHLGTCGKPKA